MTHRRYHRIRFTARGELHHQGISYQVRLENLSQGGALISSDECIMILPGDDCVLSIQLQAEPERLVATVQVVHSFFSMVGVRFVAFEKDAEQRLVELLKKSAGLPERTATVERGSAGGPPGSAEHALP